MGYVKTVGKSRKFFSPSPV